jgi:pyruvate formate lyase activating enzyme
VVREIARDAAYYDVSGGGATFSGGEPLMQPEFLLALLRGCRARGITTVVDTSGHADAAALDAVAGDVSLFLFDLKLMDDAEHRRHTGESNAPVLRNLERLAERGRAVWIRVPLVPGITMEPANLDAMTSFLRPWPSLRCVCLLPFHGAAAGKYARMGLADPMAGVAPPSERDVEAVRRRFEASGFKTTVGG